MPHSPSPKCIGRFGAEALTCIAVGEVAKLKLGFCFDAVKGSTGPKGGGFRGGGRESCLDGGLNGTISLMRATLQRRQPRASSLVIEELGQICLLMSKAEVLCYNYSDIRVNYHCRGQSTSLPTPYPEVQMLLLHWM